MANWSLVTAAGTSLALDSTNRVQVIQTYGMGMPPMTNRATDYAVLDGAAWQGARAEARSMMITLEAIGQTWGSTNGLHTVRAMLLNAVNPHRASLPVRLWYNGNRTGGRYIECYYDAGLEMGDVAGFTERMTLRLVAPDPYWYGNTAATATGSNATTLNVNYLAQWLDGVWNNMSAGTNGRVYDMAGAPAGGVYIGGDFTQYGNRAVHNIVYYRYTAKGTRTISTLGGGVRGSANDHIKAVRRAPNGDVYVGGWFHTAGTVAAAKVAYYDVSASAWKALSTGVASTCYDLDFAPDGTLYAGGAFRTAGGRVALRVAKWNGTAWSTLGGRLNGSVRALRVHEDGTLYVAGTFTSAGGGGAARIAAYKNGVWSTLGAGIAGTATVYALATDRGYLYAGGEFNTAGGVSCANIARWNGAAWEPLGDGLNNDVYNITPLENGWLLVGGRFNASGDVAHPSRVALWNGYSFVPLPVVFTDFAQAFAEDAVTGAWYIGGNMDSATTVISGATTVTNAGNARAYPQITIMATADEQRVLYLRNDTNERTLWLDYTLQDGEALTIDCRPGYKTVRSSYFGNHIRNTPLPGSHLATFCLEPGANRLSMLVSGGHVTTTITYQPAYWSID